MSKHRAYAPSLSQRIALVVGEVRSQMSAQQILEAAEALTYGTDAYKTHLTVSGRPVRLENRGSSACMGRFGGGWMTSIGIQMGSSGVRGTIIINLGHGSIRIDPRGKS